MQDIITNLAKGITHAIGASLNSDSSRIKTLALAEGEAMAEALVRIGLLVMREEIDLDEAEVLLRVQRDASEAVLASLAEVSRVAATRALNNALKATIADGGQLAGPSSFAGLLRLLTS